MTHDPAPARAAVDVVVIGGCGRVGLPLAITMADSGLRVAVLDVNQDALATVTRGRMPFSEPGAGPVLERVVADGSLAATSDAAVIATAQVVVIAVGTPVDDLGGPDTAALDAAVRSCSAHLRYGQLVVLRSTVFPGSTARLEKALTDTGREVDVVYCPERIAEGKAMVELRDLPQIIGSRSERARERATDLFGVLGSAPVHLDPEEAEFAKLATNAWRYLTFAVSNELYMIATRRGLDFGRIREGLQRGYPRAAGLPAAGLAAGPCLPKDTAQLAAFAGPAFAVGLAAMQVNASLPVFLVEHLAARHELDGATVGVLGMSFKQDSDDVRDSLALVVRDELVARGARVLCTDPYVDDPDLLPLEEVLARAELLVVAAPHTQYRDLEPGLPVVDVWDVVSPATRI